MPQFSTIRSVPYSAQQMFDLVADIEKYPDFLPLCKALKIIKRDNNVLLATMEVGYKFINESFCTEVTLYEVKQTIEVKYIDGPFSHLDNQWHFVPLKHGCNVEFSIDYEFKSRMLGIIMGEIFQKAFVKFSEAFESRANKLYG